MKKTCRRKSRAVSVGWFRLTEPTSGETSIPTPFNEYSIQPVEPEFSIREFHRGSCPEVVPQPAEFPRETQEWSNRGFRHRGQGAEFPFGKGHVLVMILSRKNVTNVSF